MMNQTRIHVAIVDDHTLFRQGIANLLSEFGDLEVVLEAADGKELQQQLQRHPQVDIILMDINMPVMSGYTATEWVKRQYPAVHVLALSMFDDDLSIIRMIRAGAGGYVLKESRSADLYRAIKEMMDKGTFINEMVSGKMMHSIQSTPATGKSTGLTARESEFLQYCVSELTYKEIADKMFVSPRTVDNYRESLFAKLDLRSRVGLVIYAIRNRMVKV